MARTATDRLLTRAEVERLVGLRRSAIYSLMRAGKFPLPLKISGNAVRWRLSEIEAWIDALPRARGHRESTSAAA